MDSKHPIETLKEAMEYLRYFRTLFKDDKVVIGYPQSPDNGVIQLIQYPTVLLLDQLGKKIGERIYPPPSFLEDYGDAEIIPYVKRAARSIYMPTTDKVEESQHEADEEFIMRVRQLLKGAYLPRNTILALRYDNLFEDLTLEERTARQVDLRRHILEAREKARRQLYLQYEADPEAFYLSVYSKLSDVEREAFDHVKKEKRNAQEKARKEEFREKFKCVDLF